MERENHIEPYSVGLELEILMVFNMYREINK